MSFLFYILSGLLGVSNMILWGIYGDLLMEKFDLKKVFRSIAIAVFYASFLYKLNPELPLIVVVLCTIAFERVTTEIYKALIREEPQGKYAIPSDLNFRFPILLKRILGIGLLGGLVFIFSVFQFEFDKLIVLLLAGFIPALGGMAKDAPYEGFEPLKFFRSPVVSMAVGLPLIYFFPALELRFFLFSLWGGERIISECYKKIIKGNAPGKFKVDARHPVQTAWKAKRSIVLIPYWLTIALILLVGYLSIP